MRAIAWARGGAMRGAHDAEAAFSYLKATSGGRTPDDVLRVLADGMAGIADEVARLVAFLASPAASIITGSNIVADNGFTKRVQY